MDKPGFIALRMERSRPDARTRRHPDDDIRSLSPPVMHLRQVIDDLVETRRYKIRKLHLHHTLESLQAQPQRTADDSTLAKRGVADPAPAIFLDKSFGDL